MMTMSVGLDMAQVSRRRWQEILPVMNSVFMAKEVADTRRHVLVKRQIADRKAKAEALRLVRAIPEAMLDLRPAEMGHGKMLTFPHSEANAKLAAALRKVKLSASSMGIRLLPDANVQAAMVMTGEETVLIDDVPATQRQLDGLRVLIEHSELQHAYQPLERYGYKMLGHAATKTEVHLRTQVKLDDTALEELRYVLRRYDLDIGFTVNNWNPDRRLA